MVHEPVRRPAALTRFWISTDYRESSMTRQFATLLSAAAIAAGIAGAPIAAADPNPDPNQPQQSCATAGASSTVCLSPGDTEINDAPPPVSFYPYGGEPGLL
jgi:hypothetical protein